MNAAFTAGLMTVRRRASQPDALRGGASVGTARVGEGGGAAVRMKYRGGGRGEKPAGRGDQRRTYALQCSSGQLCPDLTGEARGQGVCGKHDPAGTEEYTP
ncbi:hypothetical protein ACFVZR_28650 [Streptomyces sp. NPDC058316]|uniref:hypothetical protein n=1 Tax=unclassified Streptomyces TaxID=2593676 RepID=UPI003321E050